MSQPTTKKYPAEFKERAVKLAVESEQASAQPARALGVPAHTLHTWIGKYHRAERPEPQLQEAQLSEALQRLRTANARLQEERAIVKQAAAYGAQPLPYRTPGATSRTRRSAAGAWVASWRSRAAGTLSGSAAHPRPRRTLSRRCTTTSSALLRQGGASMAHAASRLCAPRRDDQSAVAAWGASAPRQVYAAQRGAH